MTANGLPTRRDWVVQAGDADRMPCIEAYFQGHGYAPHRHDTYALGRTLAGVQSFRYQRAGRHSLPGQSIVLHSDELHDGHAGTGDGFRYRMVYLPPALLQPMLGGRPLPFVAGGISDDPRLAAPIQTLLQRMDGPLDPLQEQDALFDLAQGLCAAAGMPGGRRVCDGAAAERARQFLHDHLHAASPVTLADLERASGQDRWRLSRDFRALFGTSPYRYLTLRRLDLARTLMRQGLGAAQAADAAGFFDQSHMTRRFTQAFGVPPARWLRMQAGPAPACTIVQDAGT
ncbi:AraC family transcriptional regulator [Acidovorax sp. SUPP950]|uniref:AraC family transcriptional regulator n=1 Tax=Acidovorax sp. SUPP950 TaxID=511901 RepID=UPI0023C14071|nr:AraC family transcriptional regulator [Acidovorax sp. SUPP950]GKS74696.1 AraC family transcriptional regulator [Acidovorax sp. SUPP950]